MGWGDEIAPARARRDRTTSPITLLHPKRGLDEARDEEQDETPHAPLYPTRGGETR